MPVLQPSTCRPPPPRAVPPCAPYRPGRRGGGPRRGARRGGVLSELLARGRPLRLLLVRRFRASRVARRSASATNSITARSVSPPPMPLPSSPPGRPVRRPAAATGLRVRLPIRVAALQRADCSQSSMMQPSGSWNESAWSMPVSGSFHDRIVSCCRWSTSSLCTLALTKLLPSASLIKHGSHLRAKHGTGAWQSRERKACTLEGPTNSSGAQSMGGIPSQRWSNKKLCRAGRGAAVRHLASRAVLAPRHPMEHPRRASR